MPGDFSVTWWKAVLRRKRVYQSLSLLGLLAHRAGASVQSQFSLDSSNPDLSRREYTKAASSGINISANRCFSQEGNGFCYDRVYPIQLRISSPAPTGRGGAF